MADRALVHGLAITGASVVRALQRHGYDVRVSDDRVDDTKRELATTLGVEVHEAPVDWASTLRDVVLVSPAPGVPETHPLITTAQRLGVSVVSEIELATISFGIMAISSAMFEYQKKLKSMSMPMPLSTSPMIACNASSPSARLV